MAFMIQPKSNQPNPNFALSATRSLESSTAKMTVSLEGAIQRAKRLQGLERASIAALARRNAGAEVRVDYFMEKDITAVLTSLVQSFRAFIFVVNTLEKVEKNEGPVEAGMHSKFKGVIEAELNTLISEINTAKRIEARK